MTPTLTPAFGRDYRNKAAVQADLDLNRDFLIADMFGPFGRWHGKPVNRAQLLEQNVREVRIRYGKLRKVGLFKVKA